MTTLQAFSLQTFSTSPKPNILRLYVGPTAPPGGQLQDLANLTSVFGLLSLVIGRLASQKKNTVLKKGLGYKKPNIRKRT